MTKYSDKIAEALEGLKDKETFTIDDFRDYVKVIRNQARTYLSREVKAGTIEVVTPSHKINGNEVSNTYYRVK